MTFVASFGCLLLLFLFRVSSKVEFEEKMIKEYIKHQERLHGLVSKETGEFYVKVTGHL